MKKLKNGMKVKIKCSKIDQEKYGKPWYAENPPVIENRVTQAYKNKETCIVENAHIETASEIGGFSGWVCDLKTKNGEKLSGFCIWELRQALF